MAEKVAKLRLAIDTDEGVDKITRLQQAVRDFAKECEAINARAKVEISFEINVNQTMDRALIRMVDANELTL